MTETALIAAHAAPQGGKLMVCVDSSREARIALILASKRAAARGDGMVLVHVVEPVAEVQTLFSVADRIREERFSEAETLLQSLASYCQTEAGITPTIHIREGRVQESIIAAVQEDADINLLVLGAAPGASGKGKLVSWLSNQLGDKLLIPLMLVPGNLTDQQIDALI